MVDQEAVESSSVMNPDSVIREVGCVFLIGISRNQHREKAVPYQHTYKHATLTQNEHAQPDSVPPVCLITINICWWNIYI